MPINDSLVCNAAACSLSSIILESFPVCLAVVYLFKTKATQQPASISQAMPK